MHPFLIHEAQIVLNELVALGLDPDLALAYLESACGEAALYDEPISPEEIAERRVA